MATDTQFSSAPLGSAQRTADLLAAAQKVTGTTYDTSGKVVSQKAPEVKTIVDSGGKTYTNKGGGVVIPANALDTVAPVKLPNKLAPQAVGNMLLGTNVGLTNENFGLTVGPNNQFQYNPEKSTKAVPQGWDAQTYANFKAANPGLEPNGEDTFRMQNADSDALLRQYLGMSNANTRPSLADEYQKDLKSSGVLDLEKKVSDYTAKINSIVAKSEADSLSVVGQGQGIPQAILNNQQAAIRRNAAIEALPVQAQLSAAQGSLELAQSHLDTFFKLKSEDIKIDFEHKQKLIDAVFEFAKEDKRQKLEEKRIKDEREYNEKKANLGLINEWAKTAVQTGQSNLISAFTALDPSSPTFTEDFGKLTAQVNDPNVALDIQLKKSNLATDSLQRANIQSQINERNNGIIKDTSTRDNLVAAIIDNPALFNQLTATEKANVTPALYKQGFTQFGKPLSDGAIKDINQSQSAISDLTDLRAKIQGNEDLLGPIAGFQRLNPYSPARKLQADVDRIRQSVGKTLEGGVLRKEDEEKYKKILATLNDTPSTAISKIDNLISSINRDVENYSNLQYKAGRNVPQPDKTTAPEDLRAKYEY